ncbi:hypothetical protein M758_5G042700 [Ceratodon purpureus]|nr:hypothetical protein M758_5G042700 [Ceratodon purpureus]
MAPAFGDKSSGAAVGGDGVHVMVIPYPARGHNVASIQLSRELVRHGARVTLVNIFDNISADRLLVCRRESIAVVDVGVCPDAPGPGNLPYLREVESVQGETEQVVAEIGSPAVTCIVSDVFLGWTQSVAEKFAIPRFVLCASPARILASLLYMPTLAAQGVVPVQSGEVSELVHIPGLPPTRRGDLSPAVQASSIFCQHFYAQYLHRCCQPALEAAGWFINSFEELEPSCIDALRSFPYERVNSKKPSPIPKFFPVGPLVDDAYLQLLNSESVQGSSFVEPEAPYLRWLNKQPTDSVLYVNFGSVVSLSIRQIHELAIGLEASKQRFLLVARISTVEDTHEDHPVLPEDFVARTPETGFVQFKWVNQLDVLSHPAVGGFLTHCGWNSTLESICRGVPLLAWPFQADQMLNCRFLVDEAKTAVEVRKGANGFVSSEEVARAVRQLMAEPEGEDAKENVRKLRDKVKAAVSDDGSVQRSIKTFLAELKTRVRASN